MTKLFTVEKKMNFTVLFIVLMIASTQLFSAQNPVREKLIKITDNALHLNGVGDKTNEDKGPNTEDKYDYWFGTQLVADGDCVTAYKGFVFMAWYKGNRDNRYIQVSRYNPNTGQTKTFQLNWQHTGFRGNKNLGESHNTIAIGISPKDKTLHLLYDMHAYTAATTGRSARPGFYVNRSGTGTPIANRYFRYSFSEKDVTTISDDQWTQGNVLVKATNNNIIGNYTHNSLNGTNNPSQYEKLTYPRFFLNENNDLFFQMRVGGNTDGAIRFYKYNATNQSWGNYKAFNLLNARRSTAADAPGYNWGLYGDIKFLNGKICIGFQRRKGVNTDKYQYQDGMFFARATNANATAWENSEGTAVNSPVVNADNLNIGDPEKQLPSGGQGAEKDDIVMTGPNDFTVTERGDIHMVATVRDLHNNERAVIHYYKPLNRAWKKEIIDSNISAERIYTYNNKVYIIGLRNRKLRIDVSNGGENNFTKIYEEGNNDISYRHGTVRIVDGKVYFYGLQLVNNNDSKEPLHLNIINLNLDTDTTTVTDNTNQETEITDGWYKIKNLETGKYLRSYGRENILGASLNTGADKQWRFVKTGDYYNIDSRSTGDGNGILRATGTNIIGTKRRAPLNDVDKIWRINEVASPRGAYRIELRDSQKYIYNEINNENKLIQLSDKIGDRSKWLLELVNPNNENRTLSLDTGFESNKKKVIIYPNPAKNNFNISLNGMGNVTISISDLLGKTVYNNTTNKQLISIETNNRYTTGIYLIKIISNDNKTYYSKLVIE